MFTCLHEIGKKWVNVKNQGENIPGGYDECSNKIHIRSYYVIEFSISSTNFYLEFF